MPAITSEQIQFMNVKEAAAFMRVSVSGLYKLANYSKGFPSHKVGGKLVFEKNELTAWMLSK